MIVITVARKPLDGPTVAANALKWGTGGLNIDGTRIACEGGSPSAKCRESDRKRLRAGGTPTRKYGGIVVNWFTTLGTGTPNPADALGRWPANLILTSAVAADLDAKVGKASDDGLPTSRFFRIFDAIP